MCACVPGPVAKACGALAEAGGCWRTFCLAGCRGFRASWVQRLRCSAVTALSCSGTAGTCSHIGSLAGLCTSREVKLLASVFVGCRTCGLGGRAEMPNGCCVRLEEGKLLAQKKCIPHGT